MNTKLHAVTDARGRPIRLFITVDQVCDYTEGQGIAEQSSVR